jgi:hypothetical protein
MNLDLSSRNTLAVLIAAAVIVVVGYAAYSVRMTGNMQPLFHSTPNEPLQNPGK